jgi:hypothetical protein
LVETAADVIGTVNSYLPLFVGAEVVDPGLLPPPSSAISVAYDFMGDAGEAISDEFAAGLGVAGTVSELISASDLAPSESWTASDFNTAFLGQRHDLVFIGAHFSTASALAADYVTRFSAAEVQASSVDLFGAIVASQGCHSGYNTVDLHAIQSVTLWPDWAQALARKGAIFLAGTGYQYGETQLLEYGERLYLEFAKQLRTGTGPVSVGEAMVRAKLNYLAQTPNMRGIHEKTLHVGLTLYGLPMVKIDMPGERLPASGGPGVGLETSVLGGDFDLETADLSRRCGINGCGAHPAVGVGGG